MTCFLFFDKSKFQFFPVFLNYLNGFIFFTIFLENYLYPNFINKKHDELKNNFFYFFTFESKASKKEAP